MIPDTPNKGKSHLKSCIETVTELKEAYHSNPDAIALALAQHGKKEEAAAVLDACAGYATDENTRAGITRLRAELAAALTRPPADQVPAALP
jgi:hypothetical protein